MARIPDPPELWNEFWTRRTPDSQRAVAEHYIAVCYTICGDFGVKYRRHPKEFWGVAWEALYGRVPFWKLGDAPFANYAAVRVRGAIMDDVGAHGWKRHQGGEDECHRRDEGEDDEGFGKSEGSDDLSPEGRRQLTRIIRELANDCSPESRSVFKRLVVDRLTIDQVATEFDRPPAWVSARKREVAEVLKEKLTSRDQAAELMEVE